MKHIKSGLFLKGLLTVCAVLVLLAGAAPARAAIPLTNVLSVVQDTSVTLRVYNFPANQNFIVRMGLNGTFALNGVVIGEINSGVGGTFDMTINIPAQLKGQKILTLRLDSPAGYYAYDWFHNYTGNTPYTPQSGTTGTTGGAASVYYGIPATNVISVVQDTSVTLKAYNFPSNQTFTARIGPAGTLGINGTVVGTFSSGTGGTLDITLAIPAALKGSKSLSLRLDGAAGYYAYDWFYNYTGNTPYTPQPGTTGSAGTGAVAGYKGIPTISIAGVTKDTSVMVRTNNFPPNQVFTVRMGAVGTQGINGIVVGSTNSGAGGVFDVSYNIPDQLKGVAQIAIRFESGAGYYAYDWFNNK